MTYRLPALAAAFFLFAASGARADLVTNGGFETGDFSGWQVNDLYGTTFVTTSAPYVHSGTYGASLGVEPNQDVAVLSQQLATTAGDTYTITFYLRGANTPSTELNVFFGAVDLLDLVDSTQGPWTEYSFTEEATSSSTMLSFDLDGTSYGTFALDDVSVVPGAVPEPASLALFGAGLAAAFLLPRRKRIRASLR